MGAFDDWADAVWDYWDTREWCPIHQQWVYAPEDGCPLCARGEPTAAQQEFMDDE